MGEENTTPGPQRPARPPMPKMLIPLALLLGIALGGGLLALRSTPKPALPGGAALSSQPGHYYAGSLALPSKAAPPIRLHDYTGAPVSLSQFRGKAVFVTFLYTHCPNVCPLIASNLRVALERLGPRASRVQLVAVSVDPRGDTPAAIRTFLRVHGLLGRMRYLVGTPAQLRPVWTQWNVGSSPEADNPELIAHSALVYGITGSGRITTIYPATFETSQIVHDAPRLAVH